jgi:hypothetical protein
MGNAFDEAYVVISTRIRADLNARERELATLDEEARNAAFRDDLGAIEGPFARRCALRDLVTAHKSKLDGVEARYSELAPGVTKASEEIDEAGKRIPDLESALAPGGGFDRLRTGFEARAGELQAKAVRSAEERQEVENIPLQLKRLADERRQDEAKLARQKSVIDIRSRNIQHAAEQLEPISEREQRQFQGEIRTRTATRMRDVAERTAGRERDKREQLEKTDAYIADLERQIAERRALQDEYRGRSVESLPADVQEKLGELGSLANQLNLARDARRLIAPDTGTRDEQDQLRARIAEKEREISGLSAVIDNMEGTLGPSSPGAQQTRIKRQQAQDELARLRARLRR